MWVGRTGVHLAKWRTHTAWRRSGAAGIGIAKGMPVLGIEVPGWHAERNQLVPGIHPGGMSSSDVRLAGALDASLECAARVETPTVIEPAERG